MKKLLPLLLLILIGCSEPEPINMDEMLIERNGVWYTKYTNQPYSGPVFSLYENGQIEGEVTLKNGKRLSEELDKADAHPYGARPFKRENYINKFLTLTDGILEKRESDRFLKNVQNLKSLKAGQLDKLNIEVKKSKLKRNLKKGIF